MLPVPSVQPEVFAYYDFDGAVDDDAIDGKMKKLQQ